MEEEDDLPVSLHFLKKESTKGQRKAKRFYPQTCQRMPVLSVTSAFIERQNDYGSKSSQPSCQYSCLNLRRILLTMRRVCSYITCRSVRRCSPVTLVADISLDLQAPEQPVASASLSLN